MEKSPAVSLHAYQKPPPHSCTAHRLFADETTHSSIAQDLHRDVRRSLEHIHADCFSPSFRFMAAKYIQQLADVQSIHMSAYKPAVNFTRKDLEQMWWLLECEPDLSDRAEFLRLQLSVALRLESGERIAQAFDALTADSSSMSRDDACLAFMAAPTLGRWQMFSDLGRSLSAHDMTYLLDLHEQSMRDPDAGPDLWGLHRYLDTVPQQAEWRPAAQHLEWATYTIDTLSPLETLECPDASDELLKLCSQGQIARRGAVCYTLRGAFGLPYPLAGPADSTSITLHGGDPGTNKFVDTIRLERSDEWHRWRGTRVRAILVGPGQGTRRVVGKWSFVLSLSEEPSG